MKTVVCFIGKERDDRQYHRRFQACNIGNQKLYIHIHTNKTNEFEYIYIRFGIYKILSYRRILS